MAFRLSFGGKHQSNGYYDDVLSIVRTLQPVSTLKSLAEALNQANFKTPTGLPWTRIRLASFLKSNKQSI